MAEKYSYKLGQFDPDHLKDSIKHTLKQLYNGKVEPIYVKHLLDTVFIREVSKHNVQSGTLDNRRKRQNSLYLALHIVERDPTDDSKIISPGKTRGTHKSDITNYTPSSYHTSFTDWFSLHIACVEKYSIGRQNSNRMYVKGDKRKLTTREYCSVIDTEMAGELHDENFTTRQPERITECLVSGMKTFAGRFAAAMQNKNELMSTKEWKRQTEVIISLSVYLIVLDKIYHKQKRGCGLKHAATSIIPQEMPKQVKDIFSMSVHQSTLRRKRRIKKRMTQRRLADMDIVHTNHQRSHAERQFIKRQRLKRRKRFENSPQTLHQIPRNRVGRNLMKRQWLIPRKCRMLLK